MLELQLSKYLNINHSFQGNVSTVLYPYLMTCYSQHLETSNQKTDVILDENGNVKHGQETVSSAIPEKHEQGSITVVPETQENVISILRSVVPETQESVISTLRSVVPETQEGQDVSGTEHSEVHRIPAHKIVVPETQGAEHVVVTEHSDVCAIPAQKIVVPETQGAEHIVVSEHSDVCAIPTQKIVVPETQEGEDVSGKEHSDGRAIPKPKIVVPETQGPDDDQSVVHAIPEMQETPDVHQVEETSVHETVLPECVVKVARLPETQLAKGIEFCFVSRDYNN